MPRPRSKVNPSVIDPKTFIKFDFMSYPPLVPVGNACAAAGLQGGIQNNSGFEELSVLAHAKSCWISRHGLSIVVLISCSPVWAQRTQGSRASRLRHNGS